MLGVFTSTFIYSLLTLRMIDSPQSKDFIPNVSIVLTLASVIVLIYFSSHLTTHIQPSTVIASVYDDIMKAAAHDADRGLQGENEPRSHDPSLGEHLHGRQPRVPSGKPPRAVRGGVGFHPQHRPGGLEPVGARPPRTPGAGAGKGESVKTGRHQGGLDADGGGLISRDGAELLSR